jgi:hypothetical protein
MLAPSQIQPFLDLDAVEIGHRLKRAGIQRRPRPRRSISNIFRSAGQSCSLIQQTLTAGGRVSSLLVISIFARGIAWHLNHINSAMRDDLWRIAGDGRARLPIASATKGKIVAGRRLPVRMSAGHSWAVREAAAPTSRAVTKKVIFLNADTCFPHRLTSRPLRSFD